MNMDNLTTKDSNDQKGFVDELEGIVNNEPLKNKYETVKFHKLNIFPYFLIGKVVSKFDFDGISKYLNGVGMLIGPDIVLTVAHNLCHMTLNPLNNTKKILINKKVCFFAGANGDFSIFEPVKSVKTYVPPEYITSLKTENKEEQLYNDWGLIFLSVPVGDEVFRMLEIEKSINLKKEGKLYHFFVNNQNLDIYKLSKQTKSDKISIVGYTEFKDNYRNNSAYKFLNNFTNKPEKFTKITSPKKEQTGEKGKTLKGNYNGLTNLNAHQGKIISEIVNDQDLMQINDKKININININTTNSDSVTEGLISSSRYYHQYQKVIDNPRVFASGIDYIILGNEEYNKDFDVSDVEKLIMSESKGNLLGVNLDEEDELNIHKISLMKAIKYQISTYKGQSGSPIFMRIKSMTQKQGNTYNKNNYIYQFIGMHSRRGPIVDDQKFYESEKMNNILTENLMTSEMTNNDTNNQMSAFKLNNLKSENVRAKLHANDKVHQSSENESIYQINHNNEIVKQNGMCDYNIALSIIGDSIKRIIHIIEVDCKDPLEIEKDEYDYLNNNQINSPTKWNLKSEFVMTKMYLNNMVKLTGLFKKDVPLSVLFSFGAKIFNVPKEYILLKDMSNQEFNRIHNYNFDNSKIYSKIMEDPNETTIMSFEIMLNIKKYGEFMSNNILHKFLENHDLEEEQLKKDFEKKYIKAFFYNIFSEINSFESYHHTYGKLFKKIRKTILMKLGLNESKNG